MPRAKLLVIGMGQELRGDDGIGIEVVRRWQAEYPQIAGNPDVWVETTSLPGLSLLSYLECADAAILVDAAQSGAPPGTLHVLGLDELANFGGDARSAHGWGVAETLVLAESLYKEKLPDTIMLLAVEAESMELGSPLSSIVQSKVPAAIEKLNSLVATLLAQPSPKPETLISI